MAVHIRAGHMAVPSVKDYTFVMDVQTDESGETRWFATAQVAAGRGADFESSTRRGLVDQLRWYARGLAVQEMHAAGGDSVAPLDDGWCVEESDLLRLRVRPKVALR